LVISFSLNSVTQDLCSSFERFLTPGLCTWKHQMLIKVKLSHKEWSYKMACLYSEHCSVEGSYVTTRAALFKVKQCSAIHGYIQQSGGLLLKSHTIMHGTPLTVNITSTPDFVTKWMEMVFSFCSVFLLQG
jgi:hypothetical protein